MIDIDWTSFFVCTVRDSLRWRVLWTAKHQSGSSSAHPALIRILIYSDTYFYTYFVYILLCTCVWASPFTFCELYEVTVCTILEIIQSVRNFQWECALFLVIFCCLQLLLLILIILKLGLKKLLQPDILALCERYFLYLWICNIFV